LLAIKKLEYRLRGVTKRRESILGQLEEMQARESIQEDFWTFCNRAMGFEDLYEPLHRPLCDLISNKNIKRILVLLPRGHFKTTIISICYPLYLLVNDCNERISLCSSTSQKAEENLEEVIDRAGRDLFQQWCGDRLGPPQSWVKCSRIQIRVPRDGSTTGPSVAAFGVESAEVGRHFSTMLLDDVVGQSEVNSIGTRDSVWLWFGRCLSVLDPGSRLIVLGTRWHFDDVYSRILSRLSCYTPDEKVQLMNGEQLDQKWWIERRAAEENGKLIFPTRFSKTELNEIRKVQGDYTFSCFYYNDPVGEGNNPFDVGQFHWVDYPTEKEAEENRNAHILVDPAESGEVWSANTGIVIYYAHPDNTCTVVEAIREKLHPDQLVAKIFALAKEYRALRVAIEDEAYQKSLVYWIREQMPKHDFFFNVIPVKIPRNVKKYARFEALQPFIHNGLIKFQDDMMGKKDVIEEFEQYPKGSTDDLIAALAMLPNCTVYPARKKRDKPPPQLSLTAEFCDALIQKHNGESRRMRYMPLGRLNFQ
jgi:predicted phage terminase large subunit-like protein